MHAVGNGVFYVVRAEMLQARDKVRDSSASLWRKDIVLVARALSLKSGWEEKTRRLVWNGRQPGTQTVYSQAVKRRLYVCNGYVIFGVCNSMRLFQSRIYKSSINPISNWNPHWEPLIHVKITLKKSIILLKASALHNLYPTSLRVFS
jgi:hypothetical protein